MFALTARLSKSGRVVREYVQADEADLPPGSGFGERWQVRAYAKRDASARPVWAGLPMVGKP